MCKEAASASSSGSGAEESKVKKARLRVGGGRPMPKNLGWVGARRREWGRWAAELRVPLTRERLWIGTFTSPKEAAHAYDAAVFCFYGDRIPKIRKLNFPTAPRPYIPEDVRVRLTVANIKAIAEKYAHALADYIPPPPPLPQLPVVLEAAPQAVEAPPPPAVVDDASIGVGAAATVNRGNVNEVGMDLSGIADCLLSFNNEELDQFLDFENIE
jgi:hypothetical protein